MVFGSYFRSGLQFASELHPQLSPMVTSGTLGQFQLVFQEKDVGDVLDGALDQVGVTTYITHI